VSDMPQPRQGSPTTDDDKIRTETVEVEGDHLLAKIKEIAHEGNVRRITAVYPV